MATLSDTIKRSVERDLSIAVGFFGGVVTLLEQNRPRGADSIKSEAGQAMAAMLKLASLLDARVDPARFDALADIIDGRPVLAGEFAGVCDDLLTIRVYSPFERQYLWHQVPIDADIAKPLLLHPHPRLPHSPLYRGFYVRLNDGEQGKAGRAIRLAAVQAAPAIAQLQRAAI